MWQYKQPVKIYFGNGELGRFHEIVSAMGYQNGLLVCDRFLVENGTAQRLLQGSEGLITGCFSDVQPNPTVVNVDNCAAQLRAMGADFVVAMGGGSVMDCAKAAASVATTPNSITDYHATGVVLPDSHLPMLAIPTTAGTGAEVTCSSVLTNDQKGLKAPILHDNFYPAVAIVDPELTYTVPHRVCIGTGLDVLAHAIEGYLSINHQPICDAVAIYATRLVLENLEKACSPTLDKDAKEKMATASVMAGMAFSIPKTGASHACSFVLTNRYGIPHGEACGLTLDYFVRLNAEAQEGRMHEFARQLGFGDCYALCDRIAQMKGSIGARVDLKDLGLTEEDIGILVEKSKHPNLLNSPTIITEKMLETMYRSFI